MASVSASDVNDMNDGKNYASISDNLDGNDLVLSSVDLASASNSDLVSSSKDVSNDNVKSSVIKASDVKSSVTNASNVKAKASDVKSSVTNASNVKAKASDVKSSVTNASNVKAKASKVSNSSNDTKTSTNIKSSSTKVIKGNTYSVTLKDKNGIVLSGKKLIFTFNGKDYTKTTNSKGVVSLNLNSKIGTYLIKVSFLGDDSYDSSSLSEKVSVERIPSSIKNTSTNGVKNRYYSVALKDKDGNPVTSRLVTFKFNGATYNQRTNANGIAYIKLNGNVESTYKLTYSFAGDNTYEACSGSATFILKALTTIVGSDARILKGSGYNVVLKDVFGKVLANKQVTILLNGKTYTRTSNANGIVKLTLNLVPFKSYDLTYKFAGDSVYVASSKKVTVYMKGSTSFSNSGSFACKGNAYYVTLKNYDGTPLANKKVTLYYNGIQYNKTTNSKGMAGFKVNTAPGKTYSLVYKYAGTINYGASSGSVNLRTKLATTVSGSSSTIAKGSKYIVTLKDSTGKVVANKVITYTINGKNYTRTTNANGLAGLTISAAAGNTYKMSYSFAGDSYYNGSSSDTFTLSVKLPTTIKNSGSVAFNGSAYTVTLLDADSKPVANKIITFTLNGKTYTITTNAKGVASLFVSQSALKTYTLTYKFAGDSIYMSSSGSLSLNVKTDKYFTLAQIIAAAKNLRAYVDKNGKVPATVSVNGISLNVTTFAYLISQALLNINKSSSANVWVIPVSGTYSNNGDTNFNANVYRSSYITIAEKIISYTKEHGAIPFYVNTSVGKLSPSLYIFGFAKALDFYSTDKYLPNYIILNYDDVNGKNSGGGKGNSSQYKKGLNEVESLSASELSKYLVASGNDALDTAIKTLAKTLTSGKSSTWDKANAIFTWVRDHIDYQYYADTKYKAAGTLSHRKGNCCDHANLIVALCRAANIPARFSHAQGCTFSSGLVTGHVWAQIYVNGVWYSADATSSRNELGNIHNWNTNSFYSLKQYIHLPF